MSLVDLSVLCAIVVTGTIRVVPIMFLADRSFPPHLKNWLAFVPPAIFTAIVINEVMKSETISIFGLSVGFLAAICAFLVNLLIPNLFSAVIASIVFYLFFEYYDKIMAWFS